MPLPQIAIRDGNNSPATVNTINSGRQNAADSSANVLANEDFAAIGALTETAPATDIASSGLNGRLQRIAQRLTSLLAVTPTALESGRTPVAVQTLARTTREYNDAVAVRPAVAATSARVAIPTLGSTRELYVHSNTRTFFRTGTSTIDASTAGTSHVVAADEKFHFVVPAGHTHIAFIRDSADGFVTVMPVA